MTHSSWPKWFRLDIDSETDVPAIVTDISEWDKRMHPVRIRSMTYASDEAIRGMHDPQPGTAPGLAPGVSREYNPPGKHEGLGNLTFRHTPHMGPPTQAAHDDYQVRRID
ncbi:hypothetical protein PENDEC_c010G01745 [Penicillium decumbens]|uniref:Uncharacterized protein n=1 Tax=Penicillium decumbens TaxID=69771 RepID=A0A1V6PC54_PENDC|nr:hypothetical protein PENDEC_c010G01745 [Penicillium decumbens]